MTMERKVRDVLTCPILARSLRVKQFFRLMNNSLLASFNNIKSSVSHNIPYFVVNDEVAVLPLPRSRFCKDEMGPIPSVSRINGIYLNTI